MAPAGKLPDIFLRERYEKDIKFIKVNDNYCPNYNKTALTAKFYSKYECDDADEVNPEIMCNLTRAKDMVPRQKREWPETVNQIYGWWPDPLVEIDRQDPIFYFPRRVTEITKHGVNMKQDTKKKEN